jgi:hypothetical protein
MFKFNPFRSLTVGGAVAAIGATLLGHFEPSALGPTAQTVVQAAGVLVSVLGLRNAQAKAVVELSKTIEELARRSRIP